MPQRSIPMLPLGAAHRAKWSDDLSRGAFARELALAVTLLFRGGINGAFAVWLVTQHPRWSEIFQMGSSYAFADGALGLLSVALLMPRPPGGAPPLLRATTFADALLRIGGGIALRTLPGIPDFPVSAVALFGVLGTCAAVLGVIALVAWLIRHAKRETPAPTPYSSAHALFDPLAMTGLVALIFGGYALLVGPPSTSAGLRTLGASWTGVLALAFLVAAIGAVPRLARVEPVKP
jgi:hypothetical protein